MIRARGELLSLAGAGELPNHLQFLDRRKLLIMMQAELARLRKLCSYLVRMLNY